MPKEIKTTIAVDGEAAFKRAINDATTSLRNMGTQLTLAQAEFKKDGDAMKLMETRSKALKGEIGQQEEIVKALEKAVSDSAKAYGENSDKTEKWQAELNRAKAKLANLQNELTLNEQGLDRNGKAFDDSSQKAADYQATLQTIGKNVSFQTISEGIKGVTGTIEGAIKKVFNFAKAIRETFADAGEWADTLMTDATKYGMDVETLQRWQNAADLIDTPVETIITARDKLSKKMKSGWKNGDLDMWQVLGIDLRDAETGKARDKMDIMWDLGETLLHISELQEKGSTNYDAEALSMEVFGKSWRELLPLFKAGREAANTGAGETATENRGGNIPMIRRLKNFTQQEREAFLGNEQVRSFLGEVRTAIAEKRAITGVGLTIPEVMLGLVREEIAANSKLLKFINLRPVGGKGRLNIMGKIPEAVWTEMCANLNELDLAFNQTEVDGYKVGAFIAICNATLEDSDLALAQEIVTAIGIAIAKALDKAILYGTGTKMPVGIITRLACESQPAWWGTNDPAFVDLHTSNIKSINKSTSTGAEFFAALIAELGIAKPVYSGDGLFWVMNRKTHLDIMAKALAI